MIYVYALIAVFLISWFTITPWFFALTRLKNMGYEANWRSVKRLFETLGWQVGVPMVPFIVLGALSDIVYNATWGTVMFRQWPKELFFTSRVKRGVKEGRPEALEWQFRINTIQPGHI